ncbi:hypothetical protein PAXINDRAFT_17333 [Paxillus involutus ATCC 200175]|uniref:Uncharacterized protein n=1 Tax=Paxillus involutus ATCC 200175 TaxID=664439 RepID=A0A0C9SQE6_PAXIN|nr:hypothetical protein PAXINDRAFT_17333 [Paxillus involutus ATCC 200175]
MRVFRQSNPHQSIRSRAPLHDLARAYAIRPGSYTDKATGITQIYARQGVGGVEVTDARVNWNVVVESCVWVIPPFLAPCASNTGIRPSPRKLLCLVLLPLFPSSTQSHLGSHGLAKVRDGIATLEHLHFSNREAFLSVASQRTTRFISVLGNVDEHPRKMVMTPETHLLDDNSTLGMSLNDVPGAVSEVKSRLRRVQVPSENGIHLGLVHRFGVEMEYNWRTALEPWNLPSSVI